MQKKIKMFVFRLLGKKKYEYPKSDAIGNTIWVCTKCGCHFISEECPASEAMH